MKKKAPLTVADGRLTVAADVTGPKNPAAPTVAELNAATDLSCRLVKSTYHIGAEASQILTGEARICETVDPKIIGPSQYTGTLQPFRFLDINGQPESTEDIAFDLFKEKGTTLWVYERIGADVNKPFAVGDEVSIYRVKTDNPQKPQNVSEGYVKVTVPLAIEEAYEFVKVVAGI